MITYFLPDGSKLTLLYHSPEAWAERTREQLLALGCSPAYAGQRAGLVRAATAQRPEEEEVE